jgi:metal dependent phosphohydrolase
MQHIPATYSWKIRKEAFLNHLKAAPLEAKIICLADKLSNMRLSIKTFDDKGDDMWLVFNQKDKKEQEWYYLGIYKSLPELKDTEAYIEYVKACDYAFGNS